MEVIKFGGSSLVDAAAMRQVGDVLEARKAVPKFVVLSAMGGATDALIRAGQRPNKAAPTGSRWWKNCMFGTARLASPSSSSNARDEIAKAISLLKMP